MSEIKQGGDATQTVNLIAEGKTPKLLGLVPKGQSPKLYLDLIKTQVMGVDAKGQPRPDDDLLLFLYVAKRTGLDPLTKQIYAIYRWNTRVGKETMTIQASIDGMRLVAQRSTHYAGQDDVIYNPEDEVTKYPIKASVTVYKVMSGARVPFSASARWSEYVQTDKNGIPTAMWNRMPYLMLGKCAEALALRKAFPNELSGVYAEEEMAQSTNILADLPAPVKPKIEVVSGAPDETRTPNPPTAVTIDPPIRKDGAVGLPGADTHIPGQVSPSTAPKVLLGTTQKPDFKAMQNNLKKEGPANATQK